MLIPVCVNAKNEQQNILTLLDSVFDSKEFAESQSGYRFSITVALDDCTDQTKSLCQSYGEQLELLETRGGLVSAQRDFAGRNSGAAWLIFSDADVVIEKDALLSICNAMEAEGTQVAYLKKEPLNSIRNSLLAKALHDYNKNNGYQTRRHYFNGQFFAIKNWHIPQADEIEFDRKKDNAFLSLKAGIRCDDIFLSRKVFSEFGKDAIECVDSQLYYRPPETFEGMYRKYQRMVLEIERLNHLFPDTVTLHHKYGKRQASWQRAWAKGRRHLVYFAVFNFFLTLCRLRFGFDRIFHLALNREYQTWKPVEETKAQIFQS